MIWGLLQNGGEGLPGGPVVKNPPSNAKWGRGELKVTEELVHRRSSYIIFFLIFFYLFIFF